MEAENSGSKCRICPRTFASQKAVHGHMRSHSLSERQAARHDQGGGSEDGRSAMERQRMDLMPRFTRTGKIWSFKQREGPVAPVVRRMGAIQAHVCSICMRVFSSNLALGGHLAHHSMGEKKCLDATGEDEDDDYIAAGERASGLIPPPQSRRLRAADPWPCLRCGRIFSSAQALGAHQRHCKEPPPPPLENQTKVVRDFDLNEPPPLEEEGEL